MPVSIVACLAIAVVAAAAAAWLGRRAAWQRARLNAAAIEQITTAIRRAADTERAEILRAGEVTARESARAALAPAVAQLAARRAELEGVAASLDRVAGKRGSPGS